MPPPAVADTVRSLATRRMTLALSSWGRNLTTPPPTWGGSMARMTAMEGGLHVSLGDWLTRMSFCIVPEDPASVPLLLTYSTGEGIRRGPAPMEGEVSS